MRTIASSMRVTEVDHGPAGPEVGRQVGCGRRRRRLPGHRSAILATQGEAKTAAWLKGLKDGGKVYQNNIAVMKAVNAGQVPVGIMYHYYWYRDQALTKAGSRQHQAAVLPPPGPGRVRQRLRRSGAEDEQAAARRPEVPRLCHQHGPEDARHQQQYDESKR